MEKTEERQDAQTEILLTSEDVAEVFKVDISTVEGWVIKKVLPAVHLTPQGAIGFRRDDILRFVYKHTQEWIHQHSQEKQSLAAINS
jgi:hypothetical protein